MLDILHGEPVALLTADLEELLQTVRDTLSLTERHAEVLDYIYRARVVEALVGHADVNTLASLYDHLRRMTSLLGAGPQLRGGLYAGGLMPQWWLVEWDA